MSVGSTIEELQALWPMIFPDVEGPDDRQWALWLMLHDPGIVRQALAALAIRVQKSPAEFSSRDGLLRFASSIMSRMSKERKAA